MLPALLVALALCTTGVHAGSGADPRVLKVPKPDEGKAGRLVRPRPEVPDNASAGASAAPERRDGTDLGYEAEKEEEEWLKKERRTAPLKGRSRAP